MPEEVEDAPKTAWKRIGPKYKVPIKLKKRMSGKLLSASCYAVLP